MKLSLVLQGDVGDAVVTEGIVSYTADGRNITGAKDGRPYDFWSQFVVINDPDKPDDKDAGVGVSLAFNSQAECLTSSDKGIKIKIKGVLAEYQNKDNVVVQKIDRAKIIERSAATPETKAKVGDDVTGKCRHGVVCAAIQSGQMECKSYGDVDAYVNFIEGKTPAVASEPTETATPPVPDDDIPF